MLRITLRLSDPPVFAAAWSADGAKLATGDGSGHVTIWDRATGAQLSAWFDDAHGRFHEPLRPLAVYGVGRLPNSARLASTRYDGLLQFWDTRTGAIWLRCRRAISPTRSPGIQTGVWWRRAMTMAALKSGMWPHWPRREISSRVPLLAGPMRALVARRNPDCHFARLWPAPGVGCRQWQRTRGADRNDGHQAASWRLVVA